MANKSKKSVWVIVEAEGEILLLKRGKKANNPGLWNFPGGGMEDGEAPRTTAARELWEEAGIKITASDLKYIQAVKAKGRYMVFYHLKLKKKPKVKIDFESQRFDWRTWEDFPNKLHVQTKIFHKHRDRYL